LVSFPHQAIILGKEHEVQGWTKDRLVTDQGEYVLERLEMPEQVKPHELFHLPIDVDLTQRRLLRVASIRTDSKGNLLLDGLKLSLLTVCTGGALLSGISTSEHFRIHKDRIQAIAWFEFCDRGLRSAAFETILADMAAVKAGKRTTPYFQLPSFWTGSSPFIWWSKPVWLSAFRLHILEEKPLPDLERGELTVAMMANILDEIRTALDDKYTAQPTASQVFLFVCRDQMTVRQIMAKNRGWSERTIKLRKQALTEFLHSRFRKDFAFFQSHPGLFTKAQAVLEASRLPPAEEKSEKS